MRLSRHAEGRSILHALPRRVLSAIHDYGTARHSRGAVGITLDKAAITLAAEDDRRRRAELERYRGAFIIVADGDRVITAARRMRRFRR